MLGGARKGGPCEVQSVGMWKGHVPACALYIPSVLPMWFASKQMCHMKEKPMMTISMHYPACSLWIDQINRDMRSTQYARYPIRPCFVQRCVHTQGYQAVQRSRVAQLQCLGPLRISACAKRRPRPSLLGNYNFAPTHENVHPTGDNLGRVE